MQTGGNNSISHSHGLATDLALAQLTYRTCRGRSPDNVVHVPMSVSWSVNSAQIAHWLLKKFFKKSERFFVRVSVVASPANCYIRQSFQSKNGQNSANHFGGFNCFSRLLTIHTWPPPPQPTKVWATPSGRPRLGDPVWATPSCHSQCLSYGWRISCVSLTTGYYFQTSPAGLKHYQNFPDFHDRSGCINRGQFSFMCLFT